MKVSKERKDECVAVLRKILKPDDKVWCVLRGVGGGGTSRRIDFYKIETNEPRYLSAYIGDLLGLNLGAKDGLIVRGCGMDMGFHVVYEMGRKLYPDGFGVVGENGIGLKVRPLTSEKAKIARTKGYKFYGRNGDHSGWDDDGGYALKHRWL